MAVVWTEDSSGVTLTAASVQDLVDELEANELALQQATSLVCGNITLDLAVLVASFGTSRRHLQVGILEGLKIAQELGVP